MRDRSQLPRPTASDTEALYATYFDYVWTNLRRLGVPSAQLEDACHDVFLVAHRRAADYNQRCAIKTWLFGILRRVASDYRRRSKREQQRLAELALAEPSPAHPADAWSR
ncbi:MAG: sigma-70 family RNA polymerase sigma factor, partial [Myxococcota bacterium]